MDGSPYESPGVCIPNRLEVRVSRFLTVLGTIQHSKETSLTRPPGRRVGLIFRFRGGTECPGHTRRRGTGRGR